MVATAIDTRTKPKKGNPENFKTFRMRELRVEEVNHCIWAKIKILNEYMRYHRYSHPPPIPPLIFESDINVIIYNLH